MGKNKPVPNNDNVENAEENQKLGKGKNIPMGSFNPKNTSK